MARGLGGVTVMCRWEGIIWEECVTRKYSCSNKWGQRKLVSGIPCSLCGQGAERSRVSYWHEECAQTIRWNQPQFLSPSPWLGRAWKPRRKQHRPLREWTDCCVWRVRCGFFLCGEVGMGWVMPKVSSQVLVQHQCRFWEAEENQVSVITFSVWPIMAMKSAKPFFQTVKLYTPPLHFIQKILYVKLKGKLQTNKKNIWNKYSNG